MIGKLLGSSPIGAGANAPITGGIAPVFTATQGDKSVSSGSTTTMDWAASGTPTPTIKVQRQVSAPLTVSLTSLANSGSITNGTSFTTGSISVTSGKPVLIRLTSMGFNTTDRQSPTGITGAGLTFTKITEVNYGAYTNLSVWRAMPASTTAGPLSISYSLTQDLIDWEVIQLENADTSGTNGSGAIGGTATNSATSTTVSASVTFASSGATLAFHAFSDPNSATTASATPGSGFTEFSDAATIDSAWMVAGETQFRADSDTSADVTWSRSSSIGVIALEIVPATGLTWIDETTGTNFNGPSPLTYTTPTLTVGDSGTQRRAVATNASGSVTSAAMTLTVTVGGGISQSLAITLDDIASSIAQNLRHSQTLASALEDISVSIAQSKSPAKSQAIAFTLDDVAASIAQNLSHAQTLASTLDGITVAISQGKTGSKTQSVDFTLDGISAAASQNLQHAQSISAVLDGIQVDIVQGINGALSQSLAITLDDVSSAVAQNLQHAQALSATLDGIGFAASQSASSPSKSQYLSAVLDDVTVEIVQVGADIESEDVAETYIPSAPKKKTKRTPVELQPVARLLSDIQDEFRSAEQRQPAKIEAIHPQTAMQEALSKAARKVGFTEYTDLVQQIRQANEVADDIELSRLIEIQESLDEEDMAVLAVLLIA